MKLLEVKYPNMGIVYVAEDGKQFRDKDKYMEHCESKEYLMWRNNRGKINIRTRIEIIYKKLLNKLICQ